MSIKAIIGVRATRVGARVVQMWVWCRRAGGKMILSVVVFNNYGKPRLTKFYEYMSEDMQQKFIAECFRLVSKLSENQCNFARIRSAPDQPVRKIVFRCYATLYFVFLVDENESELGILDLIQVFVETLDRCFENVCELDLIFHNGRPNWNCLQF